MNRWNIPEWLEIEVKERDTVCVYCGKQMAEHSAPERGRKDVGTWEHIINDARIVTRENIARCCAACNASKGSKDLAVWLQSKYCMRHGIGAATVAEVVREAPEMNWTEKARIDEPGKRKARQAAPSKSGVEPPQSKTRERLGSPTFNK